MDASRRFLARNSTLLIAAFLGGPSFSCSTANVQETASTPESPSDSTATPKAPPNPYLEQALDRRDLETSPCDDFYQYSCGGWISNATIPNDKARWGTIAEIAYKNSERTREILQHATQPSSLSGADDGLLKIGQFYAACMDEPAIDAAGASPLTPAFAKVDQLKNRRNLPELLAWLHLNLGTDALFRWHVLPDEKDPNVYSLQIHQGGLGFYDREYYLATDNGGKDLLRVYTSHVESMLKLGGFDSKSASKQSRAIIAFETKLARVSMTRADLRDPDNTYNKSSTDKLAKQRPGRFAWGAYFRALGIESNSQVVIQSPAFLEASLRQANKTSLPTLRAYLKWHILRAHASNLAPQFEREDFEFQAVVSGVKALPPRWERCVKKTTNTFPELVGRFYTERHFGGDSKPQAMQMIAAIEEAFRAGLQTISWMDDSTRMRAVEKLEAITNKVGFPNQWRDYSETTTTPTSHFGNVISSITSEKMRNLNRIGNAVDKAEWFMPPSIVNAYYNPSGNEIVFPAGILQPPFFHQDQPLPMNYGAIGMVMGHEITHGFDDSGRKYDGQGRLRPWWDLEIAKRFEEQTQCVEDLYGSIEVQPNVFIDGRLTLGENIADIGGLKQAYRAYRAYRANFDASSHSLEASGGLTPDQLFFLGYSQGWCTKATPEVERLLVTIDPHSPPRHRINVPLTQLPEFAAAFACEEGSAMRPATTCEVW